MSKPQTELESDLAYVRQAVENSRRAARIDAVPLAAWAGLTLVGVVLAYAVEGLDTIWLWVVLIGSAWAYTGARALQARGEPKRFSQGALANLWFGLLTAMTLIGFAGGFSGQLPTTAIPPVIGALFGVGYLASAALMGRRWLVVLAVAWWMGAGALFYAPAHLRLALFGLMVGLFLLVPALMLREPPRE